MHLHPPPGPSSPTRKEAVWTNLRRPRAGLDATGFTQPSASIGSTPHEEASGDHVKIIKLGPGVLTMVADAAGHSSLKSQAAAQRAVEIFEKHAQRIGSERSLLKRAVKKFSSKDKGPWHNPETMQAALQEAFLNAQNELTEFRNRARTKGQPTPEGTTFAFAYVSDQIQTSKEDRTGQHIAVVGKIGDTGAFVIDHTGRSHFLIDGETRPDQRSRSVFRIEKTDTAHAGGSIYSQPTQGNQLEIKSFPLLPGQSLLLGTDGVVDNLQPNQRMTQDEWKAREKGYKDEQLQHETEQTLSHITFGGRTQTAANMANAIFRDINQIRNTHGPDGHSISADEYIVARSRLNEEYDAIRERQNELLMMERPSPEERSELTRLSTARSELEKQLGELSQAGKKTIGKPDDTTGVIIHTTKVDLDH